jgi:hypothetical protein
MRRTLRLREQHPFAPDRYATGNTVFLFAVLGGVFSGDRNLETKFLDFGPALGIHWIASGHKTNYVRSGLRRGSAGSGGVRLRCRGRNRDTEQGQQCGESKSVFHHGVSMETENTRRRQTTSIGLRCLLSSLVIVYGARITAMALKSEFDWNTLPELVEKRKAELAAELEAYWTEFVPAGERFDPDKAVALLLQKVKRFEAALVQIAEKATDQNALMEHKYQTGEEVTNVDMARYASYLKTFHIAAEALGRHPLTPLLKNLEEEC